ncbi:MAG TPA: chromosome segregation protein SMC [Caldilineae bacterium]|nr:chromosome segregation protein SMC [Caldilineae bacterium]
MRLKKVQLHGYKTFANKTEFIFDKGITAIVGPNGSGKSNVADAIRWVMGEQAYSVMRGKKTEDMIFNGSSERARMGMAEAIITLDNSDNWLPIDFDEVVIGRRAYRSGENEYFINNNKVRLRDVHELLDRSGLGRRTHTVIGQGMIDKALALKPEDRRALFEEAAGITIYRTKRRRTIDQLAKTEANLTRVRDIIAEISPRLRQLERQAEKARQHEEISAELRDLLRTWYGYNWHLALSKLVDARAAVAHWQQIIERAHGNIESYNAETAALRQRQTELRSQLAEWRRLLAEHENARADFVREQAVGQERLRALRSNIERFQHEEEILRERLQGEQARLAEAETELGAINAQRQTHEVQVTQALADLHALEQARQQTESQLAEAQRKHLDFTTRLADRQNRVTQAKENRQAVKEERTAEIEAAAKALAEAQTLQQEYAQVGDELQALGEQISALRERHRTAEARQQEHVARRAKLENQRAELDAQLRAHRARYELLDRLRAEGEGLYAGVRQVIRASQRGDLSGILGPVATQLHVPDRFEQAIEVALGSRIQDVVVDSWDDAERAIAHLKATRSGRATFLPLDNLRPLRRRSTPKTPGVLGWAADLVEYDARVEPAIELLLGQILVVDDLESARRVSRQGERPRIVTLEGDFVHPGGSVSGGSRSKRQKGGMLAREREWRNLPKQIERTVSQMRELNQGIEGLNQAILSVDEELTALVKEATRLSDVERERTAVLGRLQSGIDRARQTQAWHNERAKKLALDLENFGRKLAGLRQEIGEFSEQQGIVSNRIAALEEKLATLGTTGLVQAVAQAQARLDAIDERRQSQQTLVENHRQRARQTEAEIADRRRRILALTEETAALKERLASLLTDHQQNDQAYLALTGKVAPAQQELDELEAGWIEHDRRGEALRERLHQEELQLNQAQLALQRAEDHLTYLRSQIESDFGLVALETEDGFASQEPLPFDQIVTALPRVETLPQGAKTEIRRLKGLLNRLGPINPEAQEEYAATKERHEFLSQQSLDLEDASAQMRKVIAELDQLMDQEFRRTFKEVAKAFTRYFTRLFGGGTAKLALTDANDITNTGVEIIARPPGKRPTNLSMLSGGERALTAAALIFSILSVSPTPFCVLDEVDAALDEANITRVRDVLKELTEHAQIIVITHNRGTLEAAETIYGISIGSDSVSQSLSLKLDNGRLQAAE